MGVVFTEKMPLVFYDEEAVTKEEPQANFSHTNGQCERQHQQHKPE